MPYTAYLMRLDDADHAFVEAWAYCPDAPASSLFHICTYTAELFACIFLEGE